MLSKIKTISSKLLALGLVVAILIVALIGLDFYQKAKQKQGLNENQLLKAPKEKIIDYELQTITNPNSLEEDSNTIVKYRYISEKEVPAATYEGLKEDLTKRTNNSQAFLKSVKPISDELQQEEYVAKFYSGQPFEKSGDKWYYVETATTTPTAFISQTKLTLLDQVKEFFGQKALADAIDVTTGEGDGYIFDSNSRYWNATHDNTSAIGVDNNGTSALIETFISIDSENCTISRAFLPFDTS